MAENGACELKERGRKECFNWLDSRGHTSAWSGMALHSAPKKEVMIFRCFLNLGETEVRIPF